MTYLLQFADKTSRRLSDDEGRQVLQALARQQGVVVKGAFYAYHLISACRPIQVWAEDQRDDARKRGKYFCRYGHTHEGRSDCGCKEAAFLPIPEIAHLFPK